MFDTQEATVYMLEMSFLICNVICSYSYSILDTIDIHFYQVYQKKQGGGYV